MVNEVGIEALLLDFLAGKVFCKLINKCAYHLEVTELFGA
jgi:hypothetical protein